jgi:hypothetical protein
VHFGEDAAARSLARRVNEYLADITRPVDTSRAIAKLHYSNTFARTPDVTYVFAHAGGTIWVARPLD